MVCVEVGAKKVHFQECLLIIFVAMISNVIPADVREEWVLDDFLDAAAGAETLGRVFLQETLEQIMTMALELV